MPGRAAVESPRDPACPLRIRGRCRVFSKTRSVHDCSLGHHRLWRAFDRVRNLGDPVRDVGGCRLTENAGDRSRDRRRGAGVSQAPIHDYRGGGRRRLRRAVDPARRTCRDRLLDRRGAFRRGRLHRHERLGARECPHCAGGHEVAQRRPRHLVQGGRHHRHAGRRSRAARRRALLLVPDRPAWACAGKPHRHRCAGRAVVRRVADLDLRPSRRRHLHQGRRRRRRPRRQGRGRHPGGRSAQPGDHRRQRGRQRRRLRRHGRGPVRDLRGDGGRHDGARRDLLRRPASAFLGDALSARHLRRLHRDLDHRHLLREARRQRLDHGRTLQGPDRRRRAVDRRPVDRDAVHPAEWIRRARHRGRHADYRQEPVHLRRARPGRAPV